MNEMNVNDRAEATETVIVPALNNGCSIEERAPFSEIRKIYRVCYVQFISKRACDAQGCKYSALQRAYPAKQKVFFCSDACKGKHRHATQPRLEVPCACGCGHTVICDRHLAGNLNFCKGHKRTYHRRKRDMQICGPFYSLFRSFEAHTGDENNKNFRYELREFLTFLNLEKISDMREVTSAHIVGFSIWRSRNKWRPQLTYVRAFFAYLIEIGMYERVNPVDELRYKQFNGYRVEADNCHLPITVHKTFVAIQFVGGDRTCDGPECARSVAGAYPAAQRLFFCRPGCRANHYKQKGLVPVRCAYSACGAELWRDPERAVGLNFCPGHNQLYRQEQRDTAECGPFLPLFRSYIADFATARYGDLNQPRHEIRWFFSSLTAYGLTKISQVEAAHVTRFLEERSETNQFPRADYVKKMFDYLIEVGIHCKPNPVMSRVHYDPRPVRGPRPYDDATRADIWRWLRLRGDTRAKLVVSLGEECGPRGIEVCRIQLGDIDTDEKRIWIRGTKNKINGWVSYGPKTEHWLAVWQKERPQDCGHDCLLTNSRGDPMGRSSLTDLLNAVLCKQSPSHSHEEGLETFSFHALRHTNTSLLHKHGFSAKANRKHHRWEKDASRFVYDAMDEQQQMEQYDRAMASLDAAQESKRATLAELIAGTNRLNKDKE